MAIPPNVSLSLDFTGGIQAPEKSEGLFHTFVNDPGNNLEYYRASGTTAQRPPDDAAKPTPEGLVYYDTDLGEAIVWNGATWDVIAAGGAPSAFLGLTDTPAAYTGQTLKIVRVNAG